jgi:hypothetical protein
METIATKQHANTKKANAFPSPDNMYPTRDQLLTAGLNVRNIDGGASPYLSNQLVQEIDVYAPPTTYPLTCSGTVKNSVNNISPNSAQVIVDVGTQNIWGSTYSAGSPGNTVNLTAKNVQLTSTTITSIKVTLIAIGSASHCNAGLTLYGQTIFASGTVFQNGITQTWTGSIVIPTTGANLVCNVTIEP